MFLFFFQFLYSLLLFYINRTHGWRHNYKVCVTKYGQRDMCRADMDNFLVVSSKKEICSCLLLSTFPQIGIHIVVVCHLVLHLYLGQRQHLRKRGVKRGAGPHIFSEQKQWDKNRWLCVLGDEFNVEHVFNECFRPCINMVNLLSRRLLENVCQDIWSLIKIVS